MATAPMPTVIVLASGRGERFGASGGKGNKLQALLGGKPVLEHTLDAVRASGLPWHLEDAAGHPGMGDSIACAVRATADANGWLILPADLPLIAPQTLLALAQGLGVYEAAAPVFEGRRGHPVHFGASSGAKLMSLEGNRGGAGVLASLFAIELIVNDVGCVTDIDTLADLHAAEQLLRARQQAWPH